MKTESNSPAGIGCPAAPCSEPLYVLEQRFKPGWYLEWWGDGEGGPYWTNDLTKAEKLTMKKALYEQGMLREVTLIVPNDLAQATPPGGKL